MKINLFIMALLMGSAIAFGADEVSQVAVATSSVKSEGLPVVIVDKAKYELHLANYKNGLEIFKTFKVTIGKNSGDKQIEGDQKTPEGIYRFSAKYGRQNLKPKFGAMAFYIDYPNAFDRREKKTGFDIMLHSTDDPRSACAPSRLGWMCGGG
jgi:murein L,D-transpeptidase YafK